MIKIRPAVLADAPELLRAYRENRDFLQPWEPVRDDSFFTQKGTELRLAVMEANRAAGTENRCVILAPAGGLAESRSAERGAAGSGAARSGAAESEPGEGADEIVGMISLTMIERGPVEAAHLGYWVAQSANGRGVATAAVAAMIDLAFGEMGLHRLEACTMLHNAGSQKVLGRNGFERIGLARRYLKIAGRWQDHILFQRLATEDES
ncbi:MAG: GNAT family N-acetyltransferase [Hamadaea sp.]|uniref:GNAT family N-acetyltransferase n=1 Tax=Hamadaea sp. TaxID=2024425 RepID=UPI0018319BC6|nr:GNAT family N-acetyltransferase [Hamadaea sp.]NUT18074.1 GNAT family N-acetyltransferase [Hamadaea sp.]